MKVDPDELVRVTDVMKKDTDVYSDEIKKIEAALSKIKANWGGIDADAYLSNFATFTQRMKDIPIALAKLAKKCDDTNTKYVLIDEKFNKELMEGVINSEQ